MKKSMMLIVGGILSAALPLAAETETVGDYTWTYRINGETAEIYKEYGYGFGTTAISPEPTGAVTIPATLGGKPVTSIGYAAFSGCSGLTSVTIPDSVTSIGESAFGATFRGGDRFLGGCVCLTNIVIGNSVTSIGRSAFSGCSGLTSVTIGNGVTNIGWWAFYGCSGLTSVTIPDSVTSIGMEAFCECSGLTSVTIGNGVTSIGERAFSFWSVEEGGSGGSSSLTNLVIGNSVTNIGYMAFSGCSGLTSVTIPDSVTSIGGQAFGGCSGLTSVTISGDVTDLSSGVFDGCGKLWTAWYRTLVNSSAAGGSPSVVTSVVQQVVTTVVQQVEAPYALTDHAADRTIASVTVDSDCAIDEFVLKDGEVYDSMLRIVNTADHEVKLTLPTGYVYETFEGVDPLTIPANSRNMLSITRTEDKTFLVSREKLKTIE